MSLVARFYAKSFIWLLSSLASPSKIVAAIGLIYTCCGKGYHMFWLSIENQVFGKLRKQLS
jgi:hypothetical protein